MFLSFSTRSHSDTRIRTCYENTHCPHGVPVLLHGVPVLLPVLHLAVTPAPIICLQSSTFPFLCVMFEVLIVCTLAMIVPPHRQPAPGLQLSNSTAQPAIYTRYARPFRKARKAHRPEVLTAGGPHGQRSSRPERGPHGGERGGPQRRRGTAPSRVASCMSTPCLCHPAPWRRQSVLSCTPSSRHEGQYVWILAIASVY